MRKKEAGSCPRIRRGAQTRCAERTGRRVRKIYLLKKRKGEEEKGKSTQQSRREEGWPKLKKKKGSVERPEGGAFSKERGD